MIRKALGFVAASAAIYLAIALGLVASQQSRDRTGTESLDFSRQLGRDGAEPPLETYEGADGTALGVRRMESAEPGAPLLVLVHGSGWHGAACVHMARELASRGAADVVVPDLRGHGPDPVRRGDIDHIGQLEEDLHALIAADAGADQAVVMAGHSSGGGLTIRYAGGRFGDDLDGAALLAPYLKYDAPTMRPNSGGWAHPLTRRIIGLSMLNAVGITALNHLPVIDFAFPQAVLDGPQGDTATRSYSYRLNTSFAPRSDYLDDLADLPPFLLIAGKEDEAFVAEAYQPTLSAVTDRGTYRLLDDASHLDVLYDARAVDAVAAFLAPFGADQKRRVK